MNIEKLLKAKRIYFVGKNGEIVETRGTDFVSAIKLDKDGDVALQMEEDTLFFVNSFNFKLSEYGKKWALTREEFK